MAPFGITQNLVVFGVGIHEVYQVLLAEHDTLGLSGGTGGVNAVAQIIRRSCNIGIGFRGIIQQVFHCTDAAMQAGQECVSLLECFAVHDQCCRTGISEHIGNAVIGIFGVDGEEGGAGFQNTLAGDIYLCAAGQH